MLKDKIFGSPRMFGIETEFFVIDEEGKVVNKASSVIDKLRNRLTDSNITEECGQAMIEMITFPHTSASASFGTFFADFETLLGELEDEELGLYYYGTYPGKNKGTIREDTRYRIKEKILGKEQFSIAHKCIGFHFHASLPNRSFNNAIKFFFPDINNDIKSRVLDLFNFSVAIDPAVSALMQSSPYFESKLMGKDSRIMLYRGDPMFRNKGLYSKHPMFGTLNVYAEEFKDIEESIKERTKRWSSLLKAQGSKMSDFAKKNTDPSILDSSWKPVKISSHGTIESRSSDMNSFSRIVGLSAGLKYVSKYIQKSSFKVCHDEIGNTDPFKLEDGILYVPTFSRIKQLEQASALLGFEDKNVNSYAKSFVDFLGEIMPSDKRMMLNVFNNSIDEKKTASDELIGFVKKRQGDASIIDEETSRDFALRSYDRMFRDLVKIKKICSHEEHDSLRFPKLEKFW